MRRSTPSVLKWKFCIALIKHAINIPLTYSPSPVSRQVSTSTLEFGPEWASPPEELVDHLTTLSWLLLLRWTCRSPAPESIYFVISNLYCYYYLWYRGNMVNDQTGQLVNSVYYRFWTLAVPISPKNMGGLRHVGFRSTWLWTKQVEPDHKSRLILWSYINLKKRS